jgi:hypothetical protein
MKSLARAATTLFATFALFSAATRAATPPAFPEGMEYFGLHGVYQQERTGKSVAFANITASFGKYLLNNAAVEIQFLGYGTHDEEETIGAGVNALARYHLINIGRFSLYGDVLGGGLVTCDNFPTGGTGLNFTYAGGPGMSFKIKEGLYLDGGIRFQHISNFFIEGRDRNPILNSFGGYIGLMWTR